MDEARRLESEEERALAHRDREGWLKSPEGRAEMKLLQAKVDDLVEELAANDARLEEIERMFDAIDRRIAVAIDVDRYVAPIEELRHDVKTLKAGVVVLRELQAQSSVDWVLRVVENKQVRAAILLIGGWLASTMGPEALKALLKIFGE